MTRGALPAAALMAAFALFAAAADAAPTGLPADGFAREATWRQPGRDEVRSRALEWLAAALPASSRDEALTRASAIWNAADATDGDVLDAALATLALGDPRAAAVAAAVTGGPEAFTWLESADVADFERDAVKLWVGRRLVRDDRFDEALPFLVDLDVTTAADPAALLFHRAACQHWLLETEAAADSLDRLLERAAEIPVRYERMAGLLRADVAAFERDSLDHVARRMRDLTRRLGLGMAGPTTRGVQDGVIESLDKLIAGLESRSQAGSAAGGGGGGAGTPLDAGRPAAGRAAGEVRSRDLGDGDGWGDLPPLAREEAIQQIGREYPPHYREAIEEYFRRLATGDDASPGRP